MLQSQCEKAFEAYESLIKLGVPVWEARQVLPNAAAVNMMMTWNLRSLLNFWRQRCCNRNVDEMRYFANRLLFALANSWPELHLLDNIAGPPCFTDLKCNQGKMRCTEKAWVTI